MHRKLELPDLFLAVSLIMIAVEAALANLAIVEGRYAPKDTFASLECRSATSSMNLGMAGIVYRRTHGGLRACGVRYLVGLALGVGGDIRARRFHLLLVPSHQP